MEAVPAEQELSLIAEFMVPELYVIVVGEPQYDARLEKVIVAFVNEPTSEPIQSYI